MVQESLARKFRPAGFEQPDGSRHNYTKPRPELQEAFEKWISTYESCYSSDIEEENNYESARGMIKQIGEISFREANSLLVDFDLDKNEEVNVGLFISACYNHSSDHFILLDMSGLKYAGYKLNKNKVLVNCGNGGYMLGLKALGVIINKGDCGDSFGQSCSGIVINDGNAGDMFGWGFYGMIVNNGKCGNNFGSLGNGLSVAVKKPKAYGNGLDERKLLKKDDLRRNAQLKICIEDLCEFSKNIKDEESARKFLERYGDGGDKIKSEVAEILKRSK